MSAIRVNYFTSFISRRRERYPAAQIGILWVKAGSMAFRLNNGSEDTIHAGQYCFYNSQELINLETQFNDEMFDAVAIILSPDLLQTFLNLYNAPDDYRPSSHLPIVECDDYFHSQMGTILTYFEQPTVDNASLEFVAMSLLSQLCSSASATIDMIKQSLDLSITQKVIHYIEKNIDGSITLDETASYVGTSIATLKRKLAADDLSFSNLVKVKRINFATTQLRVTNYSITQIAYEAGYKSAAHFSTAFKSIHNQTPKEFRAMLRKNRAKAAKSIQPQN
ncbi:hypothetical protein ST37_01415 (plasmid) [Vibrio sp. qd031]|uniref:AraC family transcriptional regulator n=1 Tax=Vibrio sp. qd031 TaxID=1603038 RepID=UPI000A100162|nr:AraC family transcriptional regulator [Vibrio sp. qd031]ORT52467.1 hypothetical protein ST37_01415 [Vibrio sp. qd031]